MYGGRYGMTLFCFKERASDGSDRQRVPRLLTWALVACKVQMAAIGVRLCILVYSTRLHMPDMHVPFAPLHYSQFALLRTACGLALVTALLFVTLDRGS